MSLVHAAEMNGRTVGAPMRIAYLCSDFGVPIHGSKGASIHVRELTRAL